MASFHAGMACMQAELEDKYTGLRDEMSGKLSAMLAMLEEDLEDAEADAKLEGFILTDGARSSPLALWPYSDSKPLAPRCPPPLLLPPPPPASDLLSSLPPRLSSSPLLSPPLPSRRAPRP